MNSDMTVLTEVKLKNPICVCDLRPHVKVVQIGFHIPCHDLCHLCVTVIYWAAHIHTPILPPALRQRQVT